MDQEAGLRASQDRDLVAIAQGVRAQGRLIQALAVTQSEHTRSLAQLTATIDEVKETIDEVKETIDEVKGGVTQIVGMVGTLIERGDRR